ncbi:MAG: RNA-guided endonuclease IscB [Ktedonobacteraceae bacterium]|nr:RNA-guided endonuclease IscB [Chloroflexota bacterium]
MSVFVLDRHHQPLMPCTEKRARVLLTQKRAVVHRVVPFTIRLKDRHLQESTVQPVVLKLDPGSKVTGMALARVEHTKEGEVHHALHLAHLQHRGEAVHLAMGQRARYRRRRRSANLRYRAPRFLNRRRPKGWLPPSLRSRIGNVLTWARRYQQWIPLRRIEVERVKFDLTVLQNPEVSGLEYQRGALFGWEIRAYLLEKFGHACVYCGATRVPFELDHVLARSRGGSDRVSNLVLSCHDCNRRKGNQSATAFGHLEVEAQANRPLKDAAAVNTTRFALVEALHPLGLPIGTWSGGRTRWNRDRFGVEKEHCLDALCVGDLVAVTRRRSQMVLVQAQGRGRYQRTNVDGSGFPVSYFTRAKRIRGFTTGDLVRAEVPRLPKRLKTEGTHVGRVAVRSSGSFRVGKCDGINARYCRVVQRADGFAYGQAPCPKPQQGTPASSPSLKRGASAGGGG